MSLMVIARVNSLSTSHPKGTNTLLTEIVRINHVVFVEAVQHVTLVVYNKLVDVVAVAYFADERGDEQLDEIPSTVHHLTATGVTHKLKEAVLKGTNKANSIRCCSCS